MEENIFNSTEEILEDLKAGKIVVILDDEDRENEGDVIVAAEFATTENVNFMAKYARGLICMPMDESYAERLDLPQMCPVNTDNHLTAFSVSVDHISTTTGISAEERGITARAFAAEDAKPEDFRRPGHMFPLLAKTGGVIVRKGHTEATVDLCRLAGLKPVGLCCEIMKDDGTMARRDDLIEFAKEHGLKISTVEKLIQYRKENETLVEELRSYGYKGKVSVVPLGTDFKPNSDSEELTRLANKTYSLKDDEFVFLFVGRIVKVKNIGFTLKALSIVKKKNPNFKFLLAGDGEQLDELKELAEKLGLADNVKFLGFKSREDLPMLYSRTDLLLFPSTFDTFGLVKLEAASFNTAAVALPV